MDWIDFLNFRGFFVFGEWEKGDLYVGLDII